MKNLPISETELPLPPAQLMFMDEDYETMFRNGEYMLRFPKEIQLYDTNTTVLDIGCGYGRLAYALLREFHKGAYFGLDILPKHISWLHSNLKQSLPEGSNFLHLDIKNDRYNPTGAIQPINLTFPEFPLAPEVAFLFSVFTHMYSDEIDHYLRELRNSLGYGSRICVTFFLINSEMRELEREGKSQFPLRFRQSEICSYFNEQDPLHAIGYDESWVRERIHANGFVIEHLSYGSWCGRKKTKTYQDTIIAKCI